MMDKIKTTNQLNNVVLKSMQPIGNRNLRFAGKILTKYGVSRWTDHFMALVLRYYSNLHMETKGVEGLNNPSTIKNYVNHFNVYNRIVNWTEEKILRLYQHDTRYVAALSESSSGERGTTVRDSSSQQVRNVFAETDRLSSFTGTGLLERMLAQGKDTLESPRASAISNIYLAHNPGNIAPNTIRSTVAEDSSSFRSERPERRSIEKQELTFRDQDLEGRAGTVEMAQGSQETVRTSRGPLPAKAPDEAEAFSKLGFERVSRLNTKTISYLSAQRNITGLTSGGTYVNTPAAKGYLNNSRFEHNRLQMRVQNKGIAANQDGWETELNYVAPDIVEDNAAKSHFSDELIHKARFKTETNQGTTAIGPSNQISQRSSLVLHKPVAAEAAAEEQEPQHTELYGKAAGSRTISAPRQTIALNNMDSQDISLLADRVFKILEKRIAIQKDRRGLL